MTRNVTVTFESGATHTYENVPKDITSEAVQTRAQKEFTPKVLKLNDNGNVTVTFEGGATHTYENVPKDIPNNEIFNRAQKEFTPKIVNLDGGNTSRQNVGAEKQLRNYSLGEVPSAALKNAPASAAAMGKGLYEVATNPYQTAKSIGNIVSGAMYNTLTPDSVKQISTFLNDEKGVKEAMDMANAVGGIYKDRYGSWENIKRTFAEDPVGAIGDISTILSGGGAAVSKLGKTTQLGPVIQAGNVMSTAGKYTNPLAPVGAALQSSLAAKTGSVIAAPFKGVYNLVEPLVPGGPAAIKARGYAEALGNDPAKLDTAIKLLQEGKTIEEVAVTLNSSGLAAFARESQDASTIIRDLYNARAKASQNNLANQLFQENTNLNALNQQNMPASNVSPNAPRRAVNQALSAEEQALANKQAQIAGGVANVSQVDIGAQLAKTSEAIQQNVKQTVTGPAYTAAFEAAPKAVIDVSNLATVAKGQLGELITQIKGLAPNAAALLDKYGSTKQVINMGDGLTTTVPAKAKPITLEEAHQIRQAINIDRAALKGSIEPGANITRKNLNELYDALNGSIKTGLGETSEAYKLFQNANTLFKDRVVDVFRTGSPANLSRTSTLNQPMLVGEDIVPKLLSSEGETRQFLKIYGQDPASLKTIATGVEDLYRQQVLKPGAGADAHASFMAKNEKQLAALDEAGAGIRSRLNAIDKDLGVVRAGEQALDLAAKTLKFKNTNDLRAAVVKDPAAMNMALTRMDAPAKSALARGVMQDAMAGVTSGTPGSGAKALENLTKNENTIMAALKANDPKTAAKTFADAKQMADIYRLIEETGNKLPFKKGEPTAANALATNKNIDDLTQGLPEVRAAVKKIQDQIQTGVDFEKLAAQGKTAGGGSSRLATESMGKQPNAFLNRTATIANLLLDRLKGKVDGKLAIEIAQELAKSDTAAQAFIKAETKVERGAKFKNVATQSLNALTSPAALGVTQLNQQNQNALAR
jgi:hypothetical protein